MPLSLPPELIQEIIEICSQRDRCHLRATCKVLNELADPIVFRNLRLSTRHPFVTEHQIIALATQSSKACVFAKYMEISKIPTALQSSKQSWPHFDHCDDMRIHLPTAISALKNVTRLRWNVYDHDPVWLVDSLAQAAANLPKLAEVIVGTWGRGRACVPFGLFSNLSILYVVSNPYRDVPFFISQTATAIANSPQLRDLCVGFSSVNRDIPLPSITDIFAELSAKNPLPIEHLDIQLMDGTVDRLTLPHLAHLTSFWFKTIDTSVARGVWTSFLVNNIRLSDVGIEGIITEETMSYLSSFSGLTKLVVSVDAVTDNVKNMIFVDVLPRHVNTLQMLEIHDGKSNTLVFDHTCSESLMRCQQLRDLYIRIDGLMPVQLFLDTVTRLPELKILRFHILDDYAEMVGLANFRPRPGLRYVDELMVGSRRYVLEKVEERPVRYREIQ